MATHILVGGAWLGTWAWDDVARRLRGDGHAVHAVPLRGLDDAPLPADAGVDLDTYIDDVVSLVERAHLRDVVLVGHSFSGIVASGAADRIGDRLVAVVFLDAAPFLDGEAYLDVMPSDAQAAIRATVETAGKGWLVPPPPADAFGARTRGLDQATMTAVRERMRPQPFATWTQPLHIQGDPAAGPYRHIVVACHDIRALAGLAIPRFEALRRAPWEWLELDTGHWPMFSAPDELARVLAAIGSGAG